MCECVSVYVCVGGAGSPASCPHGVPPLRISCRLQRTWCWAVSFFSCNLSLHIWLSKCKSIDYKTQFSLCFYYMFHVRRNCHHTRKPNCSGEPWLLYLYIYPLSNRFVFHRPYFELFSKILWRNPTAFLSREPMRSLLPGKYVIPAPLYNDTLMDV